ncbi:uncharacterized protein A1O9_04567 [Exophiala aquamarina CBS 119918]|uniref:Uncharacterized protein n=1 Tax=Exophiala aquamarina CBS 119918 TaxID=1182545 RepID=A0A072PIM8_9EURO|nr:uncharacterized protein A1O9_04567 [Exophiala aquamarina CBS 119918]KEF59721.1 hypothetical protein A1O9_04567 [Exophiala aquamarina CBS 119918]
MFNLSNAPTVPLDEDELSSEADEPPEDQLSPLTNFPTLKTGSLYQKAKAPPNPRRESLLTRAILAESRDDEQSLQSPSASRGLSTTSSHSTASMASTAELTSDGDATSQSRSATPSPPPPPGRFHDLLNMKKPVSPHVNVVIAPLTKDDKPAIADAGEAALEKTLGRKRCIMFACGGAESRDKDNVVAKEEPVKPDPPKRKCALTFACPTRSNTNQVKSPVSDKAENEHKTARRPSPAPLSRRKSTSDSVELSGRSADTATNAPTSHHPPPYRAQPSFHEFGSSHDETDAWIDRPQTHEQKLTLNDCMQKENRIRQIGREAEEEAEEEEREQEELELEELDDNDNEDDFASSDDGSDDGNESDDEGGFASSDDESDAGSGYRFWAPSTTTAATSIEHFNISHFSARQQSQASSVESLIHYGSPKALSMKRPITKTRPVGTKAIRMRPGTPELPDSTDFVCGTLDEDRPLEAAYLSCLEQKKRRKHILIPQDIDPSFPTTDPEEEEDEEDEVDESEHSSGGPRWLKDQFAGFEEEQRPRGRRGSHTVKSPPSSQSSTPSLHHGHTYRPVEHRRGLHRSPPPRKLFGHSPTRMRSPPPARLRSPRGSPTNANLHVPFRWGTRGLGQRPTMERTASLPDTPNPFFKNFNIGSPSISNIASGAVTPAVEEPPRLDMHVRGPVDIVIGLEKKRQKRKEKYWRQHCRKAAKEQAERRTVPGRGAERMKELGLECAERNRGYGLGQQQQLVISL